MAIIYSYPTVVPTTDDLVLGTDVNAAGQPTKNFSISSIINLIQGGATGLGATITANPSAADANGVNQSATNFVNLSGTGSVTFNNFATLAGVQIAGTVGTGFTSFSSTAVIATVITGTLQTVAQPNVTSLGTLTSLRIGNAAPAVTSIKTTMVSPGSDLALVTEKAIAAYIATKPNPETLAETLANGNTTGGTDIAVSAADDITFTDTSKALFGASNDLQIFHDASNSIVAAAGTGNLNISTNSGSVQINKSNSETMAEFAVDGAVDLYYNGIKKFETTDAGVSVVGAIISTGVSEVPDGTVAAPSYSFANDTNTGMFRPSANKVGIAGGGVLGLTVDATDTVVQGTLTVNGAFTAVDTAQASFGGKVTVSTPTATTDAANKEYLDTQSVAKTLSYKDATATTYQMNLFGDTLQLAGGTNITSAALGVAANKAVVTFNLDNSIVLSGQVKADNFTTTAGTATWATTVLAGFTSITSDLFTGPLTGNATTATALAATGAITLLGDTTSTSGPYTYTAGGALNISTTIADTTVTGKVLTGYSVVTSGAIDANDSILEAFEKIQATITGLPEGGINYIGTWNASGGGGGVPDLTVAATHVPGHYYVVGADSPAAGTFPNGGAVPPSEWKIGDWVIRADSTLNLWQKLDNTSSIEGSGAVNKVARWTSSQILGTGLITDDLSTVTIGNTGAFVVEGNATFGNTDTDTVTVKGPATFEEITRLNLGLSANGSEGTATQVLTSGGAATAMTWTTPTVGTVTSITGGAAITVTGTAAVPIVSVDYLGADNVVLSAGTAVIPLTTDTIIVNDLTTGNVAQALIGNMPFNNYSWKVGDSSSNTVVNIGDVVQFLGGDGISTALDGNGDITTSVDYVGTDNIILSASAGTPEASDELLYNDQDNVGNYNVKRATIASIVDLGNETLKQVLANNNITDGNDIAVSAADDITFTDTSKAMFGAGNDLQIYHEVTGSQNNSYIKETNTTANGSLFILSDLLYIRRNSNNQTSANFSTNVQLFEGGIERLSTTPAGVSVTGSVTTNSSGIAGVFNSGATNVVASFTSTDAIGVIQLVDNSGNVEIGAGGNGNFVVQPNGGTTQLRVGTNSSEFGGNLQIDGNLSVTGIISHTSGGGGSGTAKGGTFTKLYTTGNAGVAGIAFTINRITTGVMIFDVMLTSDTSTACAVAKKFTVVKSYGASPLFNKILDTGPDFDTSDFTVVFAQDTTDFSIKCTITPVYTNTQKIGITLDLGFGQHDATVVMN